MNSKPQFNYFPDEDIMHILIKKGAEDKAIEITPDITAEYNKEGELIGVEIVNASKAIFNMLVDDLQLKEAI